MAAEGPPPGFYIGNEGPEHYWDGSRWGEVPPEPSVETCGLKTRIFATYFLWVVTFLAFGAPRVFERLDPPTFVIVGAVLAIGATLGAFTLAFAAASDTGEQPHNVEAESHELVSPEQRFGIVLAIGFVFTVVVSLMFAFIELDEPAQAATFIAVIGVLTLWGAISIATALWQTYNRTGKIEAEYGPLLIPILLLGAIFLEAAPNGDSSRAFGLAAAVAILLFPNSLKKMVTAIPMASRLSTLIIVSIILTITLLETARV